MNWENIEGKWEQIKGTLREKFSKLTDEDLEKAHGKRDELVGKVQERYGIAKEEAEKKLETWSDTLQEAGSKLKEKAKGFAETVKEKVKDITHK